MPSTSTKHRVRWGPAYAVAHASLADVGAYGAFREGTIDRGRYCELIDGRALDFADLGLTEDQLNFSARYPLDEETFVAEALEAMRKAGVIEAVDYPREEFAALRAAVRERFDHEGRVTYIYPEEERLFFALSWIARPDLAVALGCFYGYAVIWMLPGLAAAGGRMRLIDIDEKALALAERNMTALGYGDVVEPVLCDATRWSGDEPIDFCFLDAEGPLEGGPPELREKAVYGPILERVSPSIRPGGLLVAHNVLDDDLPRTRYLADRFAAYREQQRRFSAEIDRSFDRACVIASTEGIGAYRRTAAA